jgi:uncharacterized protein (TIGR01244 family)
MKPLDDKTLVSPRQIRPEEVAAFAAEDIALIVNNRPDGEEPGQPSSAEIEAAAQAAGIGYRHIPVARGFNLDDVLAMADALDPAEGKALVCCRSGTRSTFLWALARSEQGVPRDEIIASAAAAGYDLRPIAPYLG